MAICFDENSKFYTNNVGHKKYPILIVTLKLFNKNSLNQKSITQHFNL